MAGRDNQQVPILTPPLTSTGDFLEYEISGNLDYSQATHSKTHMMVKSNTNVSTPIANAPGTSSNNHCVF